jgi:hypothetical protein
MEIFQAVFVPVLFSANTTDLRVHLVDFLDLWLDEVKTHVLVRIGLYFSGKDRAEKLMIRVVFEYGSHVGMDFSMGHLFDKSMTLRVMRRLKALPLSVLVIALQFVSWWKR